MRIPHIGKTLNTEINRLQKIQPSRRHDYYFFALFADDEGRFQYDIMSKWVGFTNDKPRREIRAARLVNAPGLIKHFKKIGQPVFVINTLKDLRIYSLLTGGNAVIQKRLADRYLKYWIAPGVCVYSFAGGFESINLVPKEKLERRPSPKLRKQVLMRDNSRCRLCGASPKRNKHVSLELHHITPYSLSGLTDENNLVTLCRLCHDKLKPHYDLSLFHKIGVDMLSKRIDDEPYLKRLQWNIYSAFMKQGALPWRALAL